MSKKDTFDLRLRFKKEREARYLSHLDLNRIFGRAFRRSRLPIWYTQGFNPHPYLRFGPPLSLGYSGAREILDFSLNSEVDPESIPSLLNGFLPPGVFVSEVHLPQNKVSKIAFSVYDVFIKGEKTKADKAQEYMSKSEVIAMKRSKKGEQEVNIVSLIEDFLIENTDGGLKINFTAVSNNQENLNPGLLVSCLKRDGIIDDNERMKVIRLDFLDVGKKPFL